MPSAILFHVAVYSVNVRITALHTPRANIILLSRIIAEV